MIIPLRGKWCSAVSDSFPLCSGSKWATRVHITPPQLLSQSICWPTCFYPNEMLIVTTLGFSRLMPTQSGFIWVYITYLVTWFYLLENARFAKIFQVVSVSYTLRELWASHVLWEVHILPQQTKRRVRWNASRNDPEQSWTIQKSGPKI